jgi:hypothetical protein
VAKQQKRCKDLLFLTSFLFKPILFGQQFEPIVQEVLFQNFFKVIQTNGRGRRVLIFGHPSLALPANLAPTPRVLNFKKKLDNLRQLLKSRA